MRYILFFFIWCVMSSCGGESKQKEANEILNLIKDFKDENDRLPYNLNEIGLEESEEGPYYYDLIGDSTEFRLWYGVGLGDSRVYESQKNSWYGPGG